MTGNDTASLPPVVAAHIAAVNAHDEDAVVATFAVRDGKIASLIVIHNTAPAY
jgi:hypothetical protein